MIERPVPAPGIVIEEIDDDLCLLRLDSSDVVVLNRTASDVWLLVVDGMTTSTIVTTLAAAYGVETGTVNLDVAHVITDLAERGFLIEQR